nr:hypothetical protein [Thiocapsa sp. KS1]
MSGPCSSRPTSLGSLDTDGVVGGQGLGNPGSAGEHLGRQVAEQQGSGLGIGLQGGVVQHRHDLSDTSQTEQTDRMLRMYREQPSAARFSHMTSASLCIPLAPSWRARPA